MSRKRSAYVSFSVLTISSAAALAGCGRGEPAQQAQVYSSVAQCKAQNPGSACDQAWQASVGEHHKSAPQFSQQAACEAQYGQGRCQAMNDERHGGSVFIPVMAGFMLGRMMSGGGYGGGGGYFGHPVYAGRGGLFSGGARVGDLAGGGGLPARTSVPVTEAGALSSPRASTRGSTIRGGFGRTAGFRGGFGG